MMDYSVDSLLSKREFMCSCGKTHSAHLKKYICRKDALNELPSCIKEFGGTKPFIIEDKATFDIAGKKVCEILKTERLDYFRKEFSEKHLEPDEVSVGSVVMNFDYSCDIIVGIGSGVINDISKIIANITHLPYIIVATAPSMDGYASSTSAVIRDGLKYSLTSKCPDCIIADTDILRNTPYRMICAGLGDMLAKYISICEWRIGNIVTGEYYCEEIACIIRSALKKCVDNYNGIKSRDEKAITSIMEGLVISGIAADYAGVSRPVSGVEHYISHIWDMRSLEFGTPYDFHGIQCGIGTLSALVFYEKIKKTSPDKEYAERKFSEFDYKKWKSELSSYLGKSADKMIEAFPQRELYNKDLFDKRSDKIVDNFDKILEIINEELPTADFIENLLKELDCPTKPEDIFPEGCDINKVLRLTKDIRDKYVLSALMFDLGILE